LENNLDNADNEQEEEFNPYLEWEIQSSKDKDFNLKKENSYMSNKKSLVISTNEDFDQ
jgi:hypothetical protein